MCLQTIDVKSFPCFFFLFLFLFLSPCALCCSQCRFVCLPACPPVSHFYYKEIELGVLGLLIRLSGCLSYIFTTLRSNLRCFVCLGVYLPIYTYVSHVHNKGFEFGSQIYATLCRNGENIC